MSDQSSDKRGHVHSTSYLLKALILPVGDVGLKGLLAVLAITGCIHANNRA